MSGIAVSLLTEDKDRLATLQRVIENLHLGDLAYGNVGFPAGSTDSVLRQVQDVRAEVVLVDIDPKNVHRAVHAIELIHSTTADITIFAVGGMHDPASIVAAMRAGAREYIERDAPPEAFVEAFSRFTASRNKIRSTSGRAKVFAVTNAKGGAGATTVAVNTAVALQEAFGGVLLLDFSNLGHAALHLNARPAFGVLDALQNLHRLDGSLLEGLITPFKGGLQLLAGPQQPSPLAPTAAELARLFDLLVSQFRYVIVDCSNRVDQTARYLSDLSNSVMLVAQADVVSLWSAARIRSFLDESSGQDRVRLVMNRYKKIPGFSDEDIEKATNCKLLWKIPNNYQCVSPAIDKGIPAALQEGQDIGKSFRSLAALLAKSVPAGDGAGDLSLPAAKLESKKNLAARLLVSPLRAGQ